MTTTAQKRLIDDVPPRDRSRPMKVLCLGHLRTGTISLDAALKILEFKPYHGKAITDMEQAARELPLLIEALTLGLGTEEERKGREPYGREEYDKVIGEHDVCLAQIKFRSAKEFD